MYARHDLAWLTQEGWHSVQAKAERGTPAHAAITRWAGANWPLVVRRHNDIAPAATHAGEACLGLAAPPDPVNGAKLRLPLRVPVRQVARHSAPLPLHAVGNALPAHWQAPFARLTKASTAFDLRVFGSLALQALTGQSYLRDASDIDLLFRPRGTTELDEGTRLLASFLDDLPLDGEIVFPSGQAVSWKEWFAVSTHTERVLVKSQTSVRLGTRAELRAELEPA